MITSNDSPEKFIKRFVEEKDLAPSTERVYNFSLHKFYRWMVVEGYKVHKVQASNITAFKKSLMREEKSPLYINLLINVLRSFFTWQQQKGYRRENITRYVKPVPLISKHRRGILSVNEINILINSIPKDNIIDNRDLLITTLAYQNALRSVELSRLNVSDIDLETNIIQIRGKGQYDKSAAHISGEAAVLLETYIQARIDNDDLHDAGPLFITYSQNPERKHKRINPAGVSSIIAGRLKAAGLKKDTISAHSLRHSAAVHLIDAGASLHLVQLFLRHSSPTITQIYTFHSNIKLLSDQKPAQMLSTPLYRQHLTEYVKH
jgi:integrase/recombinase XerD